MSHDSREIVLILDFGSQVTELIARRVRECGVYCEIVPYSISAKDLRDKKPSAVILSGGPASVSTSHSPKVSSAVFDMEIPVLGICYGQQLMCNMLGGEVMEADHREFGRSEIKIIEKSPLYDGVWEIGKSYNVWMSHGDKINSIPDGFKVVANTKNAPFAIISDEKNKFYGVQFHPEVVHTPDGAAIISNFVHNIAGCKREWNMHSFCEDAIVSIREKVGKRKVICAVSGGVDSSVVAALLHKAIEDQLTCIFVDTGMLRLNEGEQVKKLFESHFSIPLVYVDASSLFLNRLQGVVDPEEKRKIIGETFIEVFEKESEMIEDADFLAQGTLYPDVIESVSSSGGPSVTIKSHHNVGGLPERMNLKLIEPLRELFKDEVRKLGLELGMPADMIGRHPFPGPGLAIRLPGEITEEKLAILRRADDIYIDAIRDSGLYDEIWQAFAVLLPVKTVGVMGDARTYEYVCALRAVTATDGMTADYYDFSHEFLAFVAGRIINEVRGINRVVYDITSKPPGTIEWE